MAMFHDPEAKRRVVERLCGEVRRQLQDFRPPPGAPAIFTYPVDDDVLAFEERFYVAPNMLPEEFATYYFVRHLLEDKLGTPDPEKADAFFLPLYFPLYEVVEIDLGSAVRELQFIGTGKKHLICSAWDVYPRPLAARANPHCVVRGRVTGSADYIAERLGWLDERFVVFTPESTIDLDPNDIGVLPVCMPEDPGPPAEERPLLYSFCGVTNYGSLTEAHVRGRENYSLWSALERSPREDVFVGSLDEAKARFGSKTTYRDLTRWSRFTLCPAGWARWSFRLVESLDAGSIPILLSDYFVKPYSAYLPWDRFSLHLPESALGQIDDIVRAISPRKVAAMQAAIHRHREDFGLARVASLLTRSLMDVVNPLRPLEGARG